MSVTPTVRSFPLTDRHVDTAATRSVIIEILDERRHQIDHHGWTPAHDDDHATFDFAWLIGRRAMEMCNPMAADVVDCRRLFVEISAIAVAAIEALDRKDERGADQTG